MPGYLIVQSNILLTIRTICTGGNSSSCWKKLWCQIWENSQLCINCGKLECENRVGYTVWDFFDRRIQVWKDSWHFVGVTCQIWKIYFWEKMRENVQCLDMSLVVPAPLDLHPPPTPPSKCPKNLPLFYQEMRTPCTFLSGSLKNQQYM